MRDTIESSLEWVGYQYKVAVTFSHTFLLFAFRIVCTVEDLDWEDAR